MSSGVSSSTSVAVQRWRLNGSVSMRAEPFGALLYDHASRRLAFVRSARLRRLIELLDNGCPIDEALTEAGVTGHQRDRHRQAIESLAARGLLVSPVEAA